MKLYLLALSVALSGCIVEDPCEDKPDAVGLRPRLRLLSASSTSLFFRGTGYFRDSVRLLDEQGRRVDLPVDQYDEPSDIPFALHGQGKEPVLYTLLTRQYIVYLKKTDQDTLRVEYQFSKDDCGTRNLDAMWVFYNNKKVFDGFLYQTDIVVKKP
ncbi:hypothetical protein [Hymenobacter cellulosilyticus]|uniref:Lipoprotein n=1 Tax=Hymenobacter cellulosilyticus TaxID=2932248 RepID=A0A8T9QI56_9BACT|nr:hypothetical protein [Hymenobacter cellulosilyticus]UOQ74473.1 hypothetical protein MUN79_11680 [Hymenobacter cellulosilyticus]